MERILCKSRAKKQLMVKDEALDYEIFQFTVDKALKNIKKDYGLFFTPQWIVDFMVKLVNFNELVNKKDLAILEPACGLAQFLMGIKKNYPFIFKKAKLIGVEINQEVINYLKTLNIDGFKLIEGDYLLWESKDYFDLIIGNPPYGIPSLSEHYTIKVPPLVKEKYKNLYETWYGKYNVYGAFIEKSIKLLKPEGQLIFIVPATFMILDEFKKLRAFLSQNGKAEIIYLGSEVFQPEADVSVLVLNFIKSSILANMVELSEYKGGKIKTIKVGSNWKGEIVTFETNFSKALESNSSYKLGDIYDIRISPRTPEIKNNPYIVKDEVPNSD